MAINRKQFWFAWFVISLIYLGIVGWYLSFLDIVVILTDMVLSILFGIYILIIYLKNKNIIKVNVKNKQKGK